MLFNPSWWSYLEDPVEFILQFSVIYFKLSDNHHCVKMSCSRVVLCYILTLEFWLLWLILQVRKHSGGWGRTYSPRWFLNLMLWKVFLSYQWFCLFLVFCLVPSILPVYQSKWVLFAFCWNFSLILWAGVGAFASEGLAFTTESFFICSLFVLCLKQRTSSVRRVWVS